MRRVVSVALSVVLACSAFLGGCRAKTTAQRPAESPFTTDYELAESNADFFLAGDTVETAMTGGPFYAGAQSLPSQDTAEFDRARAKKIADIKAEAAALVKACDDAKPAMAALRSEYTVYLNKVYKEEPGLEEVALETLNRVALLGSKEVIAEQQYAALVEQPVEQAYVAAMRDYVAVTKAVELGGLYLEDANAVAGYAAVMLDGLSGSKSAKVKAANTAFDGAMESLTGNALEKLEPVAERVANVDAGLKQLASADYYFSLEAMGWMRSEMAELGPQVDSLEPRDGMTAEDVEAIKAFYAAFTEWNAALEQHMASVSTTDLVAVEDRPFPKFFGPDAAYAAGDYEPGKDFGAANEVLAMQAQADEPKQGWLASGWSAIKSGFGKAKTVVGVGVDTIGLGVSNITSVGAGLYYGNSTKEIIENIMTNTKEAADNYNKGVSGSSTFKTAGDYIEGVETGAGEAAGGTVEWGIEKILGKGKVSGTAGWAVGGLTKITAGMFTGLAKGIYKVADKKSSSADVAIGIVEIALGAIGGSKVILKGSQIPGLLAGGKEGIKAFGKTLTTLVASAANNAERKKISGAIAELLVKKGLSKAEAMKLVSNSIKLEINGAMSQLIKGSREAMIKKIRDLVASGGTGFLTSFKGTVKSSLEDLLQKGFKRTFQGYLDAGTTVMGATLTDYVDNLIAAGLTDGMLTQLIGTAMAIPPDPEQVSGTWKGSITITKVDIPAGEEQNAEEAGCEQVFKKLEGKKNAATFAIKLAEGGSGTVRMEGGIGSGSGSARYADGAITMTVKSSGSTFTMKGAVSFDKASGGMKMSGTWTAPYQRSAIMMSGTFAAAK